MTYLPLIATITALLCGPLLYAVARRRAGVLAFLDGFVLVSIAGLVLLEVVPGAFGEGGAWSLGFLAVGAIGPSLLERALYRARREAHLATLALAVLGLLLHSIADGAALSAQGDPAQEALAIAVVVHSIPVGLVVWWIMAPVFGALWPALTIAAMCAGTASGFLFGIELNQVLGAQAFAWFQALVAGSILHVVFGRPHLDEHEHETHAAPPFEGLGNLAALLALALLDSLDPQHGLLGGFVERFRDLAVQCAPALVLAYLMMALLGTGRSGWGSRWILRGAPLGRAIRATLLGLVLPMRSGGGLVQYRERVQAGESSLTSMPFLVATPAVGLAALLLSMALLGFELTVLRVASAAALTIALGLTMSRFKTLESEAPPPPALQDRPWGGAVWRAGLADLVDGTAAWILAGLALAVFVSPYLDALALSAWPPGLDVLLFALLGLPMVLCAAGATPVVAVLLGAGLSPGAGLAVLLIGPVANLATLDVLRHQHGTRFAVVFGAAVCVAAIALGGLVNALAPGLETPRLEQEPTTSILGASCALVLAGLFTASLLRSGGRRWISGLLVFPRAVETSS
ncbi:MAG: permease [Panacagrimonas sp.]